MVRDRDYESTGRNGVDPRALGRRTVLGASLAGLAGIGVAGTAAAQEDLPNELEVVCLGDRLEYAFEVDGRVEFGDQAGDRDEIENGRTVNGVISGRGRDNYHFSGEITAFEITEGEDDAQLTLNGEAVTPGDLGSGSGESLEGGELDYGITIRPASREVPYELTVDGLLEQASDGGVQIPEGQSTTSSTLAEDDEHAYRFEGVSMWLEIPEGTAEFTVELADDGSTGPDRLPHRLFVRGLSEEFVTYRFSVSGDLEFGDAAEEDEGEETDIPADGRVGENTVEGHVHAHRDDPLTDDYRFSGSLAFEQAEGPLQVQVKPNDDWEPPETRDE